LEVLKRPASLQARCQALVEAALTKGAPDNVTVVLVQALDAGPDSKP
jgi:serine/threonine protein phosphatase PrpC